MGSNDQTPHPNPSSFRFNLVLFMVGLWSCCPTNFLTFLFEPWTTRMVFYNFFWIYLSIMTSLWFYRHPQFLERQAWRVMVEKSIFLFAVLFFIKIGMTCGIHVCCTREYYYVLVPVDGGKVCHKKTINNHLRSMLF